MILNLTIKNVLYYDHMIYGKYILSIIYSVNIIVCLQRFITFYNTIICIYYLPVLLYLHNT